jgi:hypothetical protein
METWPESFESQYYSYYDTADGLRAYTLTGIAVLTLKGGGPGWHRETFESRSTFQTFRISHPATL